MDNEAAVIRAQMSRTRADIDLKLEQLEQRAREMSPARYWDRHKPDFFLDRAVGSMLTLIGLRMALGNYRHFRRRGMKTAGTRMAVV
jgi:hypothetical protein